MHTMASDDTEITLGVGKLLGLFFLLAAICGVFFSIGYSLGKSSGREQAMNDQPAQVNAAPDANGGKLAAEREQAFGRGCRETRHASAGYRGGRMLPTQQNNMTFYKAVQQSGPSAQSAAAASQPPATAAPARSESRGSEAAAPVTSPPATTTPARRLATGSGSHLAHLAGDRAGNDCGADRSGLARR